MKLKPAFAFALDLAKTEGRQLVGYVFYCPGCQHAHVFYTSGVKTWGFNGNMESPTFTPSLLNRCETHLNPKQRRCHLNLIEGKLHFHGDCSHDLAGKVVDLTEWPYAEG
jgi:hypothetical protein